MCSHKVSRPGDHPCSFPFPILRVGSSIALLIAIAISGCSKESLKDAYDSAKSQTQDLASSTQELASSAKESVSTAVKAVEAKLPSKGSMVLQSDFSIPDPQRASVELIVIGDGRPNVVQICSYDPTSDQLIYPAVLLHGPTDLTSIGELSGTSVACDLYMQAESSSVIAMTKPGGHVDVMFGPLNAEDQTLTATIQPGEVTGSDQKTYQVQGGQVIAAVNTEGN
ncbi:hypothetical protein SAMN06265222_10561 [Neorhodopirellula lusitana]|uniref:Lipoprotein n=1 Tax=Neorhodopirellula lusitana TaxID=445327 RepID=A0ABY1Q222_9BACT|nr:hypothetical protein SAMN06265222_10561 [Neorhodopirellula lusitana]